MSNPIRAALRQFKEHPGFALVTVLVLGLGAGATTTVFTIVSSVVLRPLPYEAPDRLVTIWDTDVTKGLDHDPISPVNFMDQRCLPVFEDAAAWWRPGVNLVDPDKDPVRVNTIEVSGNLFEVLGVGPQIGPGFPLGGSLHVRDELIAVISDRLWRSRYGANPSIIGQPLSFNDTPYTVVGVMPPGFNYPDDIDVWQRLRWDMTQHSRRAHFMESVARLAEGTTLEQAQSAIDALTLRLQGAEDLKSSPDKGWGSRLVPLLDEQLGYYRPALVVLFGAVSLLLLIAVLNIASLLLTRALSRKKEIAVRIAMGASPRQLVTQLISESFMLSLAGAVVGLLAAAAALPIIISLTPVEIPRLAETSLDLRVLGLSLAVALGATVIFSVVPTVVLLRGQLTTGLRAGERGSTGGARRIYSVLVGAEVSVACALLVGSALLVRTVGGMMDTPTGVDADDIVTTKVQLPFNAYPDWNVVAKTHARIIEQIRTRPGIAAAGGGNFLPLGVGWRGSFSVDGQAQPERSEDLPQAQHHSVSEGYFESLGAVMAAGRGFTPFDNASGAPVVIVNQSFARRYLADTSVVGRVLQIYATGIGPLGRSIMARDLPGSRSTFEVVGVVQDVRNAPLGQRVEPAIYFSTRQFPFRELYLTVSASDRATAVAGIQSALATVVPDVPMAAIRTWGDRFAERTAEPRLLMVVLVFFGALAGLLAAIGVYGLVSWSVALRTRELAIRMTLGAQPRGIGRLVIGQSVALVVGGLGVGLALVRLSEGVLTRVLYQVEPGDAASSLVAGGLLLTAALIACVPPALRAMRVDPVEGLRVD
jgi:putative ABC transport system permease protein